MLTTLDFISVVAKVMELSTGTFISQFAFPLALVTIKNCRVFFFFTDCAKYSLFTAPCIVIRRYWHRATHCRACSLQENCFCPLLISSWNLYICPSHDPFDTIAKNLTIWVYFHLLLWRMSLVVFFLRMPSLKVYIFSCFLLSTHPLNASFKNNGSFTKVASSSTKWIRSEKSGSFEYLLWMDMTLLFHLSLVCPSSLDNNRHIISGVARAFYVCP